jgi:DNA polymerase-3 subunit beta
MKYIKVQKSTIQSMIDDAIRFAARQEIDDETLALKAVPASVCMTFRTNGLDVQAHDNMYGIDLTTEIVNDEGAVLFLPAKLLQQTIAKTDDEQISLGVDENHLVVKSSFGKTSLKSASGGQSKLCARLNTYPTSLSGASFAHALSMVAFTADRREEFASRCGIRVEFVDDNDINLVATDAYRIAKYQTALNCPKYEQLKKVGDFTIPIKTANNLIGVLSKVEDLIEMGLDKDHIALSWKGGYVSSSLVDEKFPDWRSVFPTNTKTTVSFLEGFQNAVRAAKVMAKGTVWACPIVTLEVKADETVFKSESDVGKSAISLTPTFTGEDLNITFNGEFLPDNIFGEVKIEMAAPLKPALFTSKSEPTWEYLVSPMLHSEVSA